MQISIDETTKRALACEAAVQHLIGYLVTHDAIPASVGLDVLRLLSRSSDRSTELLAETIELLERLKLLQHNDQKPDHTP
jgi:hypothetical protein